MTGVNLDKFYYEGKSRFSSKDFLSYCWRQRVPVFINGGDITIDWYEHASECNEARLARRSVREQSSGRVHIK